MENHTGTSATREPRPHFSSAFSRTVVDDVPAAALLELVFLRTPVAVSASFNVCGAAGGAEQSEVPTGGLLLLQVPNGAIAQKDGPESKERDWVFSSPLVERLN